MWGPGPGQSPEDLPAVQLRDPTRGHLRRPQVEGVGCLRLCLLYGGARSWVKAGRGGAHHHPGTRPSLLEGLARCSWPPCWPLRGCAARLQLRLPAHPFSRDGDFRSDLWGWLSTRLGEAAGSGGIATRGPRARHMKTLRSPDPSLPARKRARRVHPEPLPGSGGGSPPLPRPGRGAGQALQSPRPPHVTPLAFPGGWTSCGAIRSLPKLPLCSEHLPPPAPPALHRMRKGQTLHQGGVSVGGPAVGTTGGGVRTSFAGFL